MKTENSSGIKRRHTKICPWGKICSYSAPKKKTHVSTLAMCILGTSMCLLALPTSKALKDIVFRFIIEYSSSLRDFGL
jgi:hypothetical protein